MFHRWIGEDDMVGCLTCGGTWSTDDDGNAIASSGEPASDCSGDTNEQHGSAHESGHDLDCEYCAIRDYESCPNTYECNCAFCY